MMEMKKSFVEKEEKISEVEEEVFVEKEDLL